MYKQIENPISNLLISARETPDRMTILEPVQEEWTKYFVNDVECEREDIYQTILDNQFYNEPVKLEKKYHFQKHEETIEYFSQGYTHTQTKNNSNNRYSSFCLETKKFAEKNDPSGGEYNLLIAHMIYALDSFYETNISYKDNANNLQIAVRQCMTYFLEKLNDHNSPFDMLFNKLTAELLTFIFDILAFMLSKKELMNDAKNKSKELPSPELDMSSIKETWDSQWSNIKKSQFLQHYLSEIIKQTDVLLRSVLKHELFTDKALQSEIKDKFSAFKEIIKSFQVKKEAIDNSLPETQSVSSKFVSFFYQNPSQEVIFNTSNTLSPSK